MDEKIKIYINKADQAMDWKEPIPGNYNNPSCEECGDPDIQYYFTLREEDTPYLICNSCNHIFEASLR